MWIAESYCKLLIGTSWVKADLTLHVRNKRYATLQECVVQGEPCGRRHYGFEGIRGGVQVTQLPVATLFLVGKCVLQLNPVVVEDSDGGSHGIP